LTKFWPVSAMVTQYTD